MEKINCKFKDQDFHIAELSYLCNQNCHYPSNINNVLSQLSIQYCITIQAVKLIIIYLVLVMNGHSGNSAMLCLWLALTGFVSPCITIPPVLALYIKPLFLFVSCISLP